MNIRNPEVLLNAQCNAPVLTRSSTCCSSTSLLLPVSALPQPLPNADSTALSSCHRLGAGMGPNVELPVVEAWYMDSTEEDQRLPHRQNPNRPVSLQQLREIGVLNWVLNADIYENDPELEQIRKDRGYTYQDIIKVSRDTLPNYEQKLKNFYEEHLHTDEEIRYCVEGSGYFDVRDYDDQWIRVAVRKGGMIVLPAGMYHRFTLDSDNYIKAVRLFVGEPVWTPYNRPQEDLPIRKEYLSHISTKKNVLPWDKAAVPLAV